MHEKRPQLTFKQSIEVIKRLIQFAKPFKWQFLMSLILSLVLAAINMGLPIIIQRYIDDYLTPGQATIKISVWFAIAYMVGNLLKMLAQYYERYIFTVASAQTVRYIRNQLFEKINTLSMSFFDQTPTGKIISRLTNDTQTINEFWSVFLALIEGILSMIAAGIAMYTLNPTITLYFLIFAPLIAGVIGLYQKKSSLFYRRMRENLSQVNAQLNEAISGMPIIQMFHQENRMNETFNETNQAFYVSNLRLVKLNSLLLMPVIHFLRALATALVLALFSVQALNEPLDVGIIYAFTMYIANFFSPMGMMMNNLSVYQDGIVSGTRIIQLLDHEQTAPEQMNQPIEISEGRIEFKNVSFSYDGEVDVLKNISFTVEPGETVALVGQTGSGKSSIINLFMRFYEFDRGDILIDGQSIKDYPLEELRHKVGLVLQDSFLFYGDIKQNIALLKEDMSLEEIKQAAEYVNASHFIERLEDQYDSKVLERGSSYSSGERQLISFARTIARHPKILVMDEATANIDTETEMIIQDSLKSMRQNRTTIAIAHRLSTISDANQILVLDHGEIIERGTHDELLQQQGVYAQMYQVQGQSQ
ncbi:ABC transporter ATP-binding protein [Atopobacter phocae]|uniref:ABC transporter ATP-binding protein n=1 Tax=Atopobacter phocae TaxID=136492 RepID=UPI00046E7B44|nr:ABC transporter ATP-binding protein [Atopobacter phocae]